MTDISIGLFFRPQKAKLTKWKGTINLFVWLLVLHTPDKVGSFSYPLATSLGTGDQPISCFSIPLWSGLDSDQPAEDSRLPFRFHNISSAFSHDAWALQRLEAGSELFALRGLATRLTRPFQASLLVSEEWGFFIPLALFLSGKEWLWSGAWGQKRERKSQVVIRNETPRSSRVAQCSWHSNIWWILAWIAVYGSSLIVFKTVAKSSPVVYNTMPCLQRVHWNKHVLCVLSSRFQIWNW